MSISLFPAGEPLRISLTEDAAKTWGSHTAALIGFSLREGVYFGLSVLEDGRVAYLDLNQFTVDWRYDAKRDRWYDTNEERSEESDQAG